MEKSNIYIGEIIRNVMADNQVTKAELARRLGVRPQSVDYMLTRKVTILFSATPILSAVFQPIK